MRIAPALLLTALGGILADAVTFSVPGIDRNALGAVLFFVGLLWLAVEVTVALAPRGRRRPPGRAPRGPLIGRGPAARRSAMTRCCRRGVPRRRAIPTLPRSTPAD